MILFKSNQVSSTSSMPVSHPRMDPSFPYICASSLQFIHHMSLFLLGKPRRDSLQAPAPFLSERMHPEKFRIKSLALNGSKLLIDDWGVYSITSKQLQHPDGTSRRSQLPPPARVPTSVRFHGHVNKYKRTVYRYVVLLELGYCDGCYVGIKS